MTLQDKNKWRLRFKVYAVSLVTATLIIGSYLAFSEKTNGFEAIAIGVMGFAGTVFGVDYFSKPSGDQ
jgi:putative Mn2+ efflux pump MntP